MASCSTDTTDNPGPVKVEVVETDAGYQLFRAGSPYVVKGAGMAFDDVERFAAHGGNSIRNWTTDNNVQNVRELLDSAHAHGVTVALCLPLRAERHGFDYDDAAAVSAQLAAVREDVLRYRDHPALLFWIIGNELNHSYTNPAVFDAVNDVARMIHDLDPYHPVTTALEAFRPDTVAEAEKRAPDLDFLSFQTYGSLFGLPQQLESGAFDGPFMITEWGTIGYWEMEHTSWQAPVELTSSEKADVILRAHRDALEKLEGRLLGSYVFYWGQKQERTPTWFGLITESGEMTEAGDVMQRLWTGDWPANKSPRVSAMLLDNKTARENVTLLEGEQYDAIFEAEDPDGDVLIYRWEVKPESTSAAAGGDHEKAIGDIVGLLSDPGEALTTLTAPGPGRYRLFAYAYDGQGHAAHANVPFLVVSGEER